MQRSGLKSSEKLIVGAFVFFTFFVLVAYGGSTAATMINGEKEPQYTFRMTLKSRIAPSHVCIKVW